MRTAKRIAEGNILENRKLLVLGAGASRGVSYRSEMPVPSPLDRDFFDLLQRFKHSGNDRVAVTDVLRWAKELPFEYWRSMEQCFYTLQSRSFLAEKLDTLGALPTDADIVTAFVNATGALLRAAHGRRTCENHRRLIDNLTYDDTILTFNYDLVIERAMSQISEISSKAFGPWLYATDLDKRPKGWCAPWLLKLHGSFSWNNPSAGKQRFPLRLKTWDDLEEAPGFNRFKISGTEFPIFLPFWDKRIERQPWLSIWQNAFLRLQGCSSLVVWGYSLPRTDLKALQLFSLARLANTKLCVIDLSDETQDHWRRLFPDSKFWSYHTIEEFLEKPPEWWNKGK